MHILAGFSGDEQLAVLAVQARLFASHPDDIKYRRGLAKNVVHLFERPIGGLGVEEVHNGEDESVTVKKKKSACAIIAVEEEEDPYITAKMM